MVNRTKFDQSIGSLDQSLQELLHRLEGQVCNSYFNATEHYLISKSCNKRSYLFKHCLSKLCLDIGHDSMCLLLQESALSEALARLASDIDQKLDRLELDPLKDYFGEY